MPEPIKLNLGAGRTKYPGYISVDKEAACKPDVVADLKELLPFPDNYADEILLWHVIEHIEEAYQPRLLGEIRRVLKEDGIFYAAYPEFERVAKNYLENKRGLRGYWKMALFGRQAYPGDYHVSLMDTNVFKLVLETVGFTGIEAKPDPMQDFCTIVQARKGPLPDTKESILKREIWGG